MNFSEMIFNKNMLKLFESSKETFENVTEDLTQKQNEIKKKIKKKLGGMEETTFWGIIAIIIIILILLPLGIIYIVDSDKLENKIS